jgi:hypothetical protein
MIDSNAKLQALRDQERVCLLKLRIKKLYPGLLGWLRAERRQKVSLGMVYSGKKRKRTKIRTEESDRPEMAQETGQQVERFEEATVVTWPKKENEALLYDLVSKFGTIHKTFESWWKSARKADYILDMLDAVQVETVNGETPTVKLANEFGDNPAEQPFRILVPRSKGKTRQYEFYDYIENKEATVKVRFPKALPISEDEFLGLVHSLEIMDLPPLQRGRIDRIEITPVQNWFGGQEARGPDQVVP